MLGCGRRVAQSPFSTALGCAAWYRPHLEKKIVGVEKNLLPRNVGLAFSSPVVLLFSKCFVLAFILFCPAGNSLGAFPLLFFPPVFQHPGVLWVYLFFQVKFPISTSQLLPKPHVQHSRTPDPLGVQGMLDTGCGWDAPGQGSGAAFGAVLPRKMSQTGALPCLLELSVFPVACGSNTPCRALWLLCAVASPALITNCYSLAAGIFYFKLVYSWQKSGGCRSFITFCSAGLLPGFKSCLAQTDSCGSQDQESRWIWRGRAWSQQLLRKQTQVRRCSDGFPYGKGILFV